MREIQKRQKLLSQTQITLRLPLPINSPKCLVEERYFSSRLPSCEALNYSSALTLTGRLEQASDGDIFDKKRLIVTDILTYYPRLNSPKDWNLVYWHHVASVRKALFSFILENASPYQGGLIIAVVLGNTEWLVESIKPYFEITGTLHILAASGQNVALVLLMIEPLIPPILPSKLKGWLLISVVFSYLSLVGMQPSLVRAALMSCLALLSRYIFCCQYNPIYGLVLTVGILLIFRPEWMIAIGFLLSVSATLGIIILYPFIQDRVERILTFLNLRIARKSLKNSVTIRSYIVESLSAGVAAQLTTFPILFTQFGSVPLLAFIPSALVGWLIPLIINGTALAVILIGVLTKLTVFHGAASVLSTLLLWLPSDLFLSMLKFLSRYQWGVVSNPWYV